MADPIVKFDRSVLTLKTETGGYGSDSAPTPALNAILALNGVITPEQEAITREIQRGYFGRRPQQFVAKRTGFTFDVELASSGAAGTAPPWGPAMLAAGTAEVNDPGVDHIFNPVSESFGSASAYFHLNAHRYVMLGMRGTVGAEIEVNRPALLHFAMTALPADPTEVAFPTTQDYSSFREPVRVTKENWAVTLDGYTVNARRLVLNGTQQVETAEGSDAREVVISERDSDGELLIYAPLLGSKDFFAIAEAETKVALNSILGTAAGDIVEVDAQQVQLGKPIETAIGNHHGLRIPLFFVPSDAGNDEWTINAR